MFPHFNKKYRLVIDKISEDDDVMRAGITDSFEASAFINTLKSPTNTG